MCLTYLREQARYLFLGNDYDYELSSLMREVTNTNFSRSNRVSLAIYETWCKTEGVLWSAFSVSIAKISVAQILMTDDDGLLRILRYLKIKYNLEDISFKRDVSCDVVLRSKLGLIKWFYEFLSYYVYVFRDRDLPKLGFNTKMFLEMARSMFRKYSVNEIFNLYNKQRCRFCYMREYVCCDLSCIIRYRRVTLKSDIYSSSMDRYLYLYSC